LNYNFEQAILPNKTYMSPFYFTMYLLLANIIMLFWEILPGHMT
jgi:hypothetical protein